MDALNQRRTAVQGVTGEDLRVELVGAERIAAFEPLWYALYAHHADVSRDLGAMRSPEESWARRRAKYESWLAEPDAFAVLATIGGTPIGYAVVHLCEGSESWQTSEQIASVETMCLLDEYRQHHVGDRMAHAIFERCKSMSISHFTATAVAGNDGAVRFFKRYGFVPAMVTLRVATPEVLPTFGA